MKYAYLTVDLEEWYELDYLKDYDLSSSGIRVVPEIYTFLDILDKYGIKATFFVIADIAHENEDVIKEIVKRGHAIGCHGLDHRVLYEKTDEAFFNEMVKAKAIIEEVSGEEVIAYRSPCFSLEREKLELLKNAGYKIDSSKITFNQHPLYRKLDLSGFSNVDDLVYVQNDFFEYEIPTVEIGKYSIPISGGGYLRLFPMWLIKLLMKKYRRSHENFVVYLHPFELTNTALPLPKGLGMMTRFRCLVGRRRNIKKVERLICFLKKEGAQFKTFTEDRNERLERAECEMC